MSTDHIITLEAGKEAEVQPLNDNFKYLDDRCTAINSAYTALNQTVSGLSTTVAGITGGESIIDLGTNGSHNLTDNSVHKIVINATTTLNAPTSITNPTTRLHQMLVLIKMTAKSTVTLGNVSHFFNGDAPTFPAAGYYTLLFEYDSTWGQWVCGGFKKA